MELISREATIKSLFDYHKGKKTIGQCIDDVPTIQAVPLSELQEIRQEIAEYGSICVEYVAKNRGDKDIELLIEDVLRQAKEQVLEIIDNHIKEITNEESN